MVTGHFGRRREGFILFSNHIILHGGPLGGLRTKCPFEWVWACFKSLGPSVDTPEVLQGPPELSRVWVWALYSSDDQSGLLMPQWEDHWLSHPRVAHGHGRCGFSPDLVGPLQSSGRFRCAERPYLTRESLDPDLRYIPCRCLHNWGKAKDSWNVV